MSVYRTIGPLVLLFYSVQCTVLFPVLCAELLLYSLYYMYASALMEMSRILNTGLDMETLATVVRLCENGVNPEALAMVFQELKKESAAVKVRQSTG